MGMERAAIKSLEKDRNQEKLFDLRERTLISVNLQVKIKNNKKRIIVRLSSHIL